MSPCDTPNASCIDTMFTVPPIQLPHNADNGFQESAAPSTLRNSRYPNTKLTMIDNEQITNTAIIRGPSLITLRRSLRRSNRKINAGSNTDDVDDDTATISGVFSHNPDEPSTMVTR